MPESPAAPSYGDLLALVAEQAGVITQLRAEVGALRAEVAALRRQVGRDSSNSSQPPSQDDPGAKATSRSDKRSGEQSDGQGPEGGRPRRGQGGQKGHRGTGLARVAHPDRVEAVEPAACGGCGAGLADAIGRVASSVQVFDLPTFSLQVCEYLMMRRTCPCGHATTADLPPGIRGGPTCYGPNVSAAATPCNATAGSGPT